MEDDRTVVAAAEAVAVTGTKAHFGSTLFRGHLVGAAQRGAVEGPTTGISFPGHLLASLARLGGARSVAEAVANLPGKIGGTTASGLGRNLWRWDVFPGKKRGSEIGKTKRGKGTKCLVVGDGQGLPLGIQLASASPHEVTLIESALEQVAVPRAGRGRPRKNPTRLIYDRAADSDPLRQRLWRRGIELICPHRENRTKPKLQDGRKLRRYRRRWKIERLIAWLGNYRRLVVRYERKTSMYLAFMHVACLMITLRQF